MRRLGLAALASIAAMPLASAAELSVSAAWEGWSRSGGLSEIEVAAPATDAHKNAVGIEIEGANGLTLQAGPAAVPGATQRWRLAVPVDAEITLRTVGNATTSLTARYTFKVPEQPLFAWIAGSMATTPVPALPGLRIESMSVAALPRIASSYTSVHGVIASGDALAQLDDLQLRALLEHLRRCGWALIAVASPEAQAILTRAAGCGGRNLLNTASLPDASALAAALEARDQTQLPEPGRMAAVAEPGPALAGLGAALLAYFIGVLIMLTSAVRSRWLLAAPLLAGTAALSWLSLSTGKFTLTVWAESDANDNSARYSALVAGRGALPRKANVVLPPVLGTGALLAAPAATALQWDETGQRFTNASLPVRLFTEARLQLQGTFPVTGQVEIQREDQTLMLRNRRPTVLADAWLIHQGKQFRISNLQPNASARLNVERGAAPQGPVQRLAADRLAHDEAGLLMPIDLAAIGRRDALAAGPGFLLIRQRLTETSL